MTRDFGAPQPTLEGMKTSGSIDLSGGASFRLNGVLLSRNRGTFLTGKLLIAMKMTADVF